MVFDVNELMMVMILQWARHKRARASLATFAVWHGGFSSDSDSDPLCFIHFGCSWADLSSLNNLEFVIGPPSPSLTFSNVTCSLHSKINLANFLN